MTSTRQPAVIAEKNEKDLLGAIESRIPAITNRKLVKGKVVKIERDEVFVDVGYKTEGIVRSNELSLAHNIKPENIVSVGDDIEALVLDKEDREGRLILSVKRAKYEHAWEELEAKKEKDEIISGRVIEIVRGGVIVDIGLRGFLPASLLDVSKVFDLNKFLGQEIEVKLVDLDKQRNNVVVSRRAVVAETAKETRKELLGDLSVGQIREGVVSSVVAFGAFVELLTVEGNQSGVDGLVHVSELSWKHFKSSADVVKVGEKVNVEITEIDEANNRISLSIKATQPDPFSTYARTHQLGQIVEGRVTNTNQAFGAFVSLQDDVEGLIHISELAERHVDSANQVTSVGEHVYAKIIDVDVKGRRISLSIKQANASVNVETEDFDPQLYGMNYEVNDEGEYVFPEGFNPETNTWNDGFEEQKAKWEADYLAAYEIYKKHKEQAVKAAELDAEAATERAAGGADKKARKVIKKDSQEDGEITNSLADNDALASLAQALEA